MTHPETFELSTGQVLLAKALVPAEADCLFVMGHGSGSNMDVPLMRALSDAFAEVRIATFRFQYPYSSHPDYIPGQDMPVDPNAVLVDTVRSALTAAKARYAGLKHYVGGHSMSGIATTFADHDAPLGVEGMDNLVFHLPMLDKRVWSLNLANVATAVIYLAMRPVFVGSKG